MQSGYRSKGYPFNSLAPRDASFTLTASTAACLVERASPRKPSTLPLRSPPKSLSSPMGGGASGKPVAATPDAAATATRARARRCWCVDGRERVGVLRVVAMQLASRLRPVGEHVMARDWARPSSST